MLKNPDPRPPDSWTVKFVMVALAGVLWWAGARLIGVDEWEAAVLGGAAAIICARWLAVQSLR